MGDEMREIWMTDLEELDLSSAWLKNRITRERLKKLERLKSLQAKKQAAAGEYLLNTALLQLKRRAILLPGICSISVPAVYEKNRYGAPFLPGNPLYFNWSHSGKIAALAVSDSPVGMDVQEKRRYHPSIAKKYYPKTILDAMERSDEEGRSQLFFRCWTVLEAWLKAKGQGFYGYEMPTFPGGLSKKGQIFGKDKIRWNYEFLKLEDGYEACVVTKP